MANPSFYKDEFDRLASNGVIGDSYGQPAYAYLRVSSKGQAEEGRSGLPRQIEHCHEIAREKGYRITWEMVYADDDTGTEYEYREQLTELRNEFKSPTHRRAQAVVMEHLDRLSRNAAWHQGFLLEEMTKNGVTPVFWKAFTSRVEQAVMGAVAQDGMEQAKSRMLEGTLRKAKDGRVTAKRRLYGYNFVDDHGRIVEKPGKWTYYAIHASEKVIVERIFKEITKGTAAHGLAEMLNREGVLPPGKMARWSQGQICYMVKNPAYKGEYVHNRTRTVTRKYIDDFGAIKKHVHIEQRPQSDWITVPIPAIVDLGDWEFANEMLDKNKKTATRHASHHYLLRGLLKCSCCGRSYVGSVSKTTDKRLKSQATWTKKIYHCRNGSVTARKARKCIGRQVQCTVLDNAVWSVVRDIYLHPEKFMHALDKLLSTDRNRSLQDQIDYLTTEIDAFPHKDELLRRFAFAGAYDEYEFAAQRKALKAEIQQKTIERDTLRSQVISTEEIEERKRLIFSISQNAPTLDIDPPDETKQKLIRLLVNRIDFNASTMEFEIDGVYRGTYAIVNGSAIKTTHNTPFKIRFSLRENRVLSTDVMLPIGNANQKDAHR